MRSWAATARVCGAVWALARSANSQIWPAQLAEECLRVGLPGMAADQHDAVRGPQIDRTKQHPLGIGAGDRHHGLRPRERPSRAQWREQPQQRPIQAQQHVARSPARFQAPDQSPFFWARCVARPA